MYARGSDLPVVTKSTRSIRLARSPTAGQFTAPTASAATRLDPRFNQILQVGVNRRIDVQVDDREREKRFAQGLSFNLQYLLGKGLDNTPLLTQLTVQSEAGRSDPSNIDRDLGPNPLDMRHNFNGNIVYTSINHSSNPVVRQLLSGNEIGVLIQINSGLPFNIPSNRDLNGDGVEQR